MVFGTAVVYDLIARDKASRTFRKVAGSASHAERGFGRMGAAAKRAAFDIGAVGIAVGVVSVKMATDFQSSMTKIQSMAGGSAKDVRELSKQVLNLGKYAEQSPKELADSLYHLKSVGMDNVAAMKALRQSSDLAAVGGNNLEETTNALAGAWRSGIKGSKDFKGSVATLNAIVGAGNMKMEDLTAAMGTGFLPTAKAFGVGLKQVGAALALMTDEGVPADAAATRLRMSLSLLGAPSGAAEKVLGGIGLTGHKLGETLRKKNGLIKTIQLLKDHLRGLNNFYPNPQKADAFVAKWKSTVDKLLKRKPGTPLTTAQSTLIDQYGMAKQGLIAAGGALDPAEQAAVLSKAFGGGRSSSAILTMINNLDVLKQKQDQINGSVGRFGQSVAAQRKTADAQFKLLKSSAEVLAVKLGNTLLPYVVRFVRFLNAKAMPKLEDFANWFDKKGAPAVGRFTKKAEPFVKDVLAKTRDILKDAAPYAKDFVDAFNKLPKSVKTSLGAAAVLGLGAKKLGLFSLLGRRGGLGRGSGLLGLVSKAKPVPVLVMNKGFTGAPVPGPGGGPGGGGKFLAFLRGGVTPAAALTLNHYLDKWFTSHYKGTTPKGINPAKVAKDVKVAGLLGGWSDKIGSAVPLLHTSGEAARQGVEAADKALAGLVSSGHAKAAREQFKALRVEADKQGVSIDTLRAKFPKYVAAINNIPGKHPTWLTLPNWADAIARVLKYGGMLDHLDGKTVHTFIKTSIAHNEGRLARNNARTPGASMYAGATGAIVTRPTYGLIGEAGPEAIVPLNRAPGASALPRSMGGGLTVHEQHFHGVDYHQWKRDQEHDMRVAALGGADFRG